MSLPDWVAWRRVGAVRRYDRARHRRKDFTVVSNDCWGGEVYSWLGLPYSTPFVGLFVPGPDYARLVSDLPRYLGLPLRFGPTRYERSQLEQDVTYPVGHLDDVEIHFLHYADEATARAKWMRRCERVQWGALRIKLSGGKDLVDAGAQRAVAASPHAPLVLAAPDDRDAPPGSVRVPEFTMDGAALFLPSLRRFDVVRWVTDGVVVPPRVRVPLPPSWSPITGQAVDRSATTT